MKKGTTKPKSEMRARYRKMRVNGIQVCVHRYVMEQKLGRPLEPGEIVHHINGDRYDNHPENLELVSHKKHSRIHNKGRKLTKEHREKVSKSLEGNQRRKGILHTPEIRRQISETMKRRRHESPDLWKNCYRKSDD